MSSPWYFLLLVGLVGASKCPDGSMCGDDKLCCSLPDGDGYGCCLKEGATRALPMITVAFCTKENGCPDEYSCLKSPLGGSACCPLAQGTSCQDGHHCCPTGTHCSEDGHFCLPASNQSAILCPDKVSECPTGSTCCQMADQSYGCCPLEEATCCSDHVHCCPHNTQCDLQHSSCVSGDKVIPMFKKVPARMKLQVSATVQCDATTSCPGSSTCCRLASGEWGCCPYEKAVCCSDKEHCCPEGYTCQGGSCAQDQNTIPWLKKRPALKDETTNVPCDESSYCPDGSTCCRLPSGEWGCCPIEKAVCCSDHLHCCPSGYTCDVSTGSCNKPAGVPATAVIPLRKEPTVPEEPVDYVYCDSTHACYDGQTCCIGLGGVWTCCPLQMAVCCPDRIHCCPYGHVCLNYGAQCSRASGTPRWDEPWIKSQPLTL